MVHVIVISKMHQLIYANVTPDTNAYTSSTQMPYNSFGVQFNKQASLHTNRCPGPNFMEPRWNPYWNLHKTLVEFLLGVP